MRVLCLLGVLCCSAGVYSAEQEADASQVPTLKVTPTIKLAPATQLTSPTSAPLDKPLTQQLDAQPATAGRTLAPTTAPPDPASSAAAPAAGTQASAPAGTPGTAPAPPLQDRATAPDTQGAPATPTSGGSLLGTPLPPLPALQTVPARAQKDDREPGELLVVSESVASANLLMQQARSLGYSLRSRSVLAQLGMVVTRLGLPDNVRSEQALARLQQLLPDVRGDANHRYAPLGNDTPVALQQLGWQSQPGCGAQLRIGQVDTAINSTHPALGNGQIVERSFLPAGVIAAAGLHGSANASLLLGGLEPGLLPASTLYNAAVFRQRNRKQQDTDAMTVTQALEWLAGQQVSVIGMSLGGPRNRVLETAISRLLQRNILVVAAAGNGGAQGNAMWPAAQAGVVAVTAVDQDGRLYKRATHGDYVDFAAPGVDLRVSGADGKPTYVSGTSHAVPFAVAALALLKARSTDGSATDHQTLVRQLARSARDLEPPGRDPQTGWGLLQYPGCPTN
ncbi:MAG: S8 family serine peptidase [Alcanivoracaceae bacterium]|nr:S8 family serine peptidase [Alcanivoracaceae bacterium]